MKKKQLKPDEQHRRRCLQAVLGEAKKAGLNCRQIEELLADTGFAAVGDGTGCTIRAYSTGKKPVSARRVSLIIHGLRQAGILSSSASESSEHKNSSFTLNQWASRRKANQRAEKRTLNSRIQAIHRANSNLLKHLDQIDGSGFDGWDVKPAEMPHINQLKLIDQYGRSVVYERDRIVFLLQAANDAIMNIMLVEDTSGIAKFDPCTAGSYQPVINTKTEPNT